MNIAMIQSTPCPPEEGIGTYVFNLSQELQTRDHTVTVLTRNGLRREQRKQSGLRVVRLPCPPLFPFHVDFHGLAVNDFLNKRLHRFDIIHAHTPLTPVIDTPLPLVSTIHTSVIEDVSHVHGWSLRNLASTLMKDVSSKRLVAGQGDAADRITTVSDRVSQELDEHYGFADTTVVGNGVDAARFSPDDDIAEDYILFVGRLDYPKGVLDLLSATESLLETHDTTLMITGKGPRRDEFERRAKELGISDDVVFTGFVSRERQLELYQNATAFVLPSHYEGLPTVLLEAMSCGAPVVATRVGGCPDVIRSGVNGILVPPEDPPALAEAIGTVVGDPDLRKTLRQNARATILKEYTWEKIADRFEREYNLARETE